MNMILRRIREAVLLLHHTIWLIACTEVSPHLACGTIIGGRLVFISRLLANQSYNHMVIGVQNAILCVRDRAR